MTQNPTLCVVFFRTGTGNEPVREWLKGLAKEDKKTIGEDIKLVQFGWPLGMPLVRKLRGVQDLWEVRSNLSDRRIARILFSVEGSDMVLLHGFFKKSRRTPKSALKLAQDRKNLWQRGDDHE